jgi:hypothetical protein
MTSFFFEPPPAGAAASGFDSAFVFGFAFTSALDARVGS